MQLNERFHSNGTFWNVVYVTKGKNVQTEQNGVVGEENDKYRQTARLNASHVAKCKFVIYNSTAIFFCLV